MSISIDKTKCSAKNQEGVKSQETINQLNKDYLNKMEKAIDIG